MKKLFTLIMALLPLLALADDGSLLWLRGGKALTSRQLAIEHHQLSQGATTRQATPSETVAIALQELKNPAQQLASVTLLTDPSAALPDAEGAYSLNVKPLGNGLVGWQAYGAVITARTDLGLLYGSYALLRLQQTMKPQAVQRSECPRFGLRMLNHWDNIDGTVERGYAGRSIWKWDEMKNGRLTEALRDRLTIYARANASIGLNGAVLNNVNTQPAILTRAYINKVKAVADLLRPYGIRVWLSVNFASPMALGDTKTADPLDSKVQQWWTKKASEIYKLIPDFGGFLVKANSEGQPGPGDYHRTHAEGANMLAAALQPHGGTVIWRSFVYGANHKGEDRVKQAVSEFRPMDGQFARNVILQSKNGPLDFQPREPYAPIFDQIERTPQMAELQITQEYLGQSKHLVYLAPMWKEFFGYVSPEKLVGIAGVANTGDDVNWTGHPFSQANWYAFGRLAWDPTLSAEEIAREWLAMTFGLKSDTHDRSAVTDGLASMMLSSREACVDYMMPLGLHHIFKFDHHMGPEPDGFKAEYPIEWCPVYYHQADSAGIGFDRTVLTGSGATAQYREPYASQYESLETCPERYLLWFHHVPWTHTMRSGLTLWQELQQHYAAGVRAVEDYQRLWQSTAVRQAIDSEQWQHVDRLLDFQVCDARLWRDTCLDYFGRIK